jgi:hypothetical protein
MFHLLPLLATVLTPLLLAAHGRAAPAPAAHEDPAVARLDHAEQRAEVAGVDAVRAGERVAADLLLRPDRHLVRKRNPTAAAAGPGVVEVVVKRDEAVAAPVTNVRLAREKRWGGGGGGWGGPRGGCCAGCPGSRGW